MDVTQLEGVFIRATLGIGTTSPGELLEISGGNLKVSNYNYPKVILYDTHNHYPNVELGIASGTTAYVGTTDSTSFALRSNNSDRITILSGGNVGIGTTDPKTKLHSTGSTIVGVNNSSVGDANIGNGEVNIYLDQTNNKLKFRVRYSDGTLKSGEVALS
jgi:hypothetical protein